MEAVQNKPEKRALPLTYLALGDSYTIGESVTKQERWTYQLCDLFAEININISEPVTLATTGWTTRELLNAIEAEKTKPDSQLFTDGEMNKFDMVSLLIGVNNQFRGYSIDEYRKEFCELLDIAVKFANGNKKRVLVLSIPDWGCSPFGEKDKRGRERIRKEVEEFNAVNKEETLKQGIYYADIFEASTETDLSFFAPDDPDLVHPSGKQYKAWADVAFSVFRKEVQEISK